VRQFIDRLLRLLGLRSNDPIERAVADEHDRETRQRAKDDRLDGRGPPIVGG